MKKFIALVIVVFVFAFAFSYSDSRHYEVPFSLSITGSASGQDSIVLDTIELPFRTDWRFNRIIGTVQWDSITKHQPSGSMLLCTLMTVLKTHYGGITTTVDSTKLTQASAATSLHNLIEGGVRDSLYGDRMFLILRLADTVGVTTDSTVTIRGRIRLLHCFD